VRGLRRSDLLAVHAPPSVGWVDLLREAWSVGAAILPLDVRLPANRVTELIDRAAPTAIVRDVAEDVERRSGGVPVDDVVRLVVATSGTAGTPKLAELSEAALAAGITASAARIGAGPDDPWLACLPVAHIGGMLVLLRAVVLGAPVEVRPTFDVDAVRTAVRNGARFTSFVPTMLSRLIDARVDLTPFGAILVGGSAFDPDLYARATAAGARAIATYGLTESCGGVVYDGVPLDGVLADVEPPDGRILLGGPTLMRGYRIDPGATAAAFDPLGRLRTGDAGAMEDGVLTVYGRLDDAIVTGGEKVWPQEVEAAIRAERLVAEALVLGEADERWGNRVVAFVVPIDPSAPPDEPALRDALRGRLPGYAVPRAFRFVPELPRTGSGKVRRRAIEGTTEPPTHPG